MKDVFTGVPADADEVAPPPLPLPTPPALLDPATPSPFWARMSGQLSRRPVRLTLACVASVLGPAVVAQAGTFTAPVVAAPVSQAPTGAADPPPAGTPVPGDTASWLALARAAAATCPGLPSSVLVAIGQVETGLGTRSDTSAAGARGPMQFLPATWAAYGADGDGDGVADVMDPADAMLGAARLLCANGGADPARLAGALWDYNHSDDYVRAVMAAAQVVP